jgi:hypothetical protein
MFVAEVIVPFTIDHAYVVAPAGPAAVFPVELAQTCTGVGVIVGVAGVGLTLTLDVFVAEQPDAFVTISVRSTVPVAPAVYVMVWRFVAEVIVPFTIDHAYVVAPAGPAALLPVEPAQTCVGVGVTVGVAGFALTVTVIVLLVTGLAVVHGEALLVMITVTWSLLLSAVVANVALFVPTLPPLTCH